MRDTSVLITILCDGDWIPMLKDLRLECCIETCEDSYSGYEGTE